MDAMLRVSKGQFASSIMWNENVSVKFDDTDIQDFSYVGAQDGSSDVIFLQNEEKFIQQIRKAKKVTIEAPFFQEWRQQFNFYVEWVEF